jgi:GH18 family chitinase
MHLTGMSGESANAESWPGWDWVAGIFLFSVTAGVVLWQNSRLGVLWDLSYVLENAYRISLGDLPYRDFPFPYPPLTFLIQSLLIRLTGRVFFHHVLYCAVVGGLSTLLTWRILNHLLRGAVASARLAAFLIALPLTVVGIYCVFTHPFYDPDCTFGVLLGVFLLQRSERQNSSRLCAFFTGVILAVPLFVKQNTGLAFLASVVLAICVLAARRAWRGQPTSRYVWLIAGIIASLGLVLLIVRSTVGLRNYAHWTVQFAAARRLPPLSNLVAAHWSPLLLWWIATFVCGALLLWRSQGKRSLTALSVALLSVPFVWPLLYMFIGEDASERADYLLALWPFLLIVSLVFAIVNIRRGPEVDRILPFLLIATVEGAFLSQQLWGSTYALWPLLTLLFAGVLVALANLSGGSHPREVVSLAGVFAVSILVSGGFYVASHERLDYADLTQGQLARSALPALAGLSMRGPWIPQFEELVRFSGQEIPEDQGLLMIPGEDLFYYATGRRPRFPVLMFDHTVNPYSADEIAELARRRNIGWLVVKKNLQLNTEPMEDEGHLLDLLRRDFALVKSLGNYDIYRRQQPGPHWVGVYVPGWAQEDSAQFREHEFDSINHLLHFAVFVRPDGQLDLRSNELTPDKMRALVTQGHQSGRKVLLVVGGEKADKGLRIACSPKNLTKFAQTLGDLVESYGYDGIDLDWEPFPTRDAQLYTEAVKSLWRKLGEISARRNGNRMALTAAIEVHLNDRPYIRSLTQNLANLRQYLDQINLMTYSMANPATLPFVWHNSALYPAGKSPKAGFQTPNAADAVHAFLVAGFPPEQLGIGINLHGYAWRNKKKSNAEDLSQPGGIWKARPEVTELSYDELMRQYFSSSHYKWDDDAHVPYLSIPERQMFVSYEDERGIQEKVLYVRSHQLGGLIVWDTGGTRGINWNRRLLQMVADTIRSCAPVPAQDLKEKSQIQSSKSGKWETQAH